jgi:hypothetical protein
MSIARRTLGNHWFLLIINIDDEHDSYGYVREVKATKHPHETLIRQLARKTSEKMPMDVDIYCRDGTVGCALAEIIGFDVDERAPQCWKKFNRMKPKIEHTPNYMGFIHLDITVERGDLPY